MAYRVELLTQEGVVRFEAECDEFILDEAKDAGCPFPPPACKAGASRVGHAC